MPFLSKAFFQMKVPSRLLSPKGLSVIGIAHVLLTPAHLLLLFALLSFFLLGQTPCKLLLRRLQGLEQLFLLLGLLTKPQPFLRAAAGSWPGQRPLSCRSISGSPI